MPLDQHCLVDHLANRGMQQQSTRVICKRIAAPNLGAQIGVELVHVSAAQGFLTVPTARHNRGELGIDDDPLPG